MRINSLIIIYLICLLATLPGPVYAQELAPVKVADGAAKELSLLYDEFETVKKGLLDLHRDALVLRESSQFPAPSQVSIFLAMGRLPQFQLESIEVRLNDKLVSNYAYTAHKREALQKGGVHRLYSGALNPGSHTVKAIFRGKTAKIEGYFNSATFDFKKTATPKVFTLEIIDFLQDNTPAMTIRENRQGDR